MEVNGIARICVFAPADAPALTRRLSVPARCDDRSRAARGSMGAGILFRVEAVIIPFCGKCLFKVPRVTVRLTALAAAHRLRHDRGNGN
jgi:hypothetical protein